MREEAGLYNAQKNIAILLNTTTKNERKIKHFFLLYEKKKVKERNIKTFQIHKMGKKKFFASKTYKTPKMKFSLCI